jgi:hypothetical protein
MPLGNKVFKAESQCERAAREDARHALTGLMEQTGFSGIALIEVARRRIAR